MTNNRGIRVDIVACGVVDRIGQVECKTVRLSASWKRTAHGKANNVTLPCAMSNLYIGLQSPCCHRSEILNSIGMFDECKCFHFLISAHPYLSAQT